ncbi:MAG: hypothetical protein HY563_02645 [Ignavibacteriales bacterium]|nr:hypothetical protein [Ignavibacteriales bacterium]
MAVRTIDQAEAEDRRQRIMIITLFSVGILGLSYLVYDYLQIVNRASIPENLHSMDPIVAKWEAEGLVTDFDVPQARLIVNEAAWDRKERDEKIGIVTQLARYCAEKNAETRWRLTVLGKRSSAVLGEIGTSGLKIN